MRSLNTSIMAGATCAALALATPAKAQEQYDVTVSAGSIGGGWFVLMTTLFETYKKSIDGLNYNTVPGGSVANPIAVSGNTSQFALAYSTSLFAAKNGDEPYDQAMDNLRAIANVGISADVHAFVTEDLGISSLGEVAKRQLPLEIDTGPRGTGGELAASRVLAAHGAPYEKIEEWGGQITHSPYREAMDRVLDGHIDAFMNDELLGEPLFEEFASAPGIILLPLDADAIDELVDKYGYTASVIPAGTYDKQDEDLPTTRQSAIFFTNDEMPEGLVYEMTKVLFEEKDALVAGHASYKNLEVMEGPNGVAIPLHPGAERYYREVGALN